jgi:hypothetical protein
VTVIHCPSFLFKVDPEWRFFHRPDGWGVRLGLRADVLSAIERVTFYEKFLFIE